MKEKQFTNDLITETSPYLLQHAHNPVDWKPWKRDITEKAEREEKLMVISIGYSSCHWCHVMEKESFEDPEVAKVMNAHYLPVKIDREEHPDVDLIYMNAIQLMTGSGGWPLNVVTLPDGRPVWGGTYFPKKHWIDALQQIQKIYNQQPEKLQEYAAKLEEGIKETDLVTLNPEKVDFKNIELEPILSHWKKHFDHKNGGLQRAPKFMMPNNYHFLLRLAFQTKDEDLMDFVNLTLTKMAFGGVFDHINGGFSRYSVDEKWHVPHFEKMLYDNAQLVSLYSDAYSISENPLYKEVVYETLAFIKREMTDDSGGFYTALDADSQNAQGENEEGAYYVFTKGELKEIIQGDFPLFADYYNVNRYGKWEEDKYVLIRNKLDAAICKEFNISGEELKAKKEEWKTKLLSYRNHRPRPRLDNKILTSWNALMLKGYLDAWRVFKEPEFLDAAKKNAAFLNDRQIKEDGALYRNYNKGNSTIAAYLEDYALLISALIKLYEYTLEEKWAVLAKKLTEYTFEKFFDEKTSMFYFSSKEERTLVTQTREIRDNVIPASNSVHANNLFWLGYFFGDEKFSACARQMLSNVIPEIAAYPTGYSNWLHLLLNYKLPYYQLVIAGKKTLEKLQEIHTAFLPDVMMAGSVEKSNLPLLENRFVDGKTLIYVCKNNSCKLPLSRTEEVLKEIRN